MSPGKKVLSGGGMELSSENSYCSVAAVSRDGKPLDVSRSLSVAVMTKSLNSKSVVKIYETEVSEDEVIQGFGNMEAGARVVKKKVSVQTDPGVAPVLIEPVKCKITLRTSNTSAPDIYPLNADGSKMARIPAELKDGKYTFSTKGINTLYYRVEFKEK